MFKKISIIVSSLFLFSSVTLFITKMLEPVNADIAVANLTSEYILEETSSDQPLLKNTNITETKYLFFCALSDDVCKYITENIVNQVSIELGVDTLDFLDFVDMDVSYSNYTPVRLKATFGIEDYPAFVALNQTGDSNEIINTLEYDEKDPFTIEEFKKWLALNGLYDGYIEKEGDLIDEPAQ